MARFLRHVSLSSLKWQDVRYTPAKRGGVDFISGFVEENGYSPSFDEIARELNLKSLATVHKHITNLQKRDRRSEPTIAAVPSIFCRPKASPAEPDRLPLMGRIAAGLPVDAAED